MTKAEGIGVKTATITWEEIPKHLRNGFIRNYTVFYQPEGGEALGAWASSPLKTPEPTGGVAASPPPSAPLGPSANGAGAPPG